MKECTQHLLKVKFKIQKKHFLQLIIFRRFEFYHYTVVPVHPFTASLVLIAFKNVIAFKIALGYELWSTRAIPKLGTIIGFMREGTPTDMSRYPGYFFFAGMKYSPVHIDSPIDVLGGLDVGLKCNVFWITLILLRCSLII